MNLSMGSVVSNLPGRARHIAQRINYEPGAYALGQHDHSSGDDQRQVSTHQPNLYQFELTGSLEASESPLMPHFAGGREAAGFLAS